MYIKYIKKNRFERLTCKWCCLNSWKKSFSFPSLLPLFPKFSHRKSIHKWSSWHEKVFPFFNSSSTHEKNSDFLLLYLFPILLSLAFSFPYVYLHSWLGLGRHISTQKSELKWLEISTKIKKTKRLFSSLHVVFPFISLRLRM